MRERVSSNTWWSQDLIATTNPRREPPLGPYTCRERAIAPVADHAMIPIWDTTVLPQLVRIVNDLGMDLTHLDFCRLYRPTGQEIFVPVVEEEAAAFHVIYVGVTEGSVSKVHRDSPGPFSIDARSSYIRSTSERCIPRLTRARCCSEGLSFIPTKSSVGFSAGSDHSSRRNS